MNIDKIRGCRLCLPLGFMGVFLFELGENKKLKCYEYLESNDAKLKKGQMLNELKN